MAQPTIRDYKGQAFNYLLEHGYSPDAAAGVLGNLIAESNLDPLAFNPAGGGQGAFGVAQWRGDRQRNLLNFARERERNAGDLMTQLDFMLAEIEGVYSGGGANTREALRNAQSPEQAAVAFENLYERSGGHALDTRQRHARRTADAISGKDVPLFENPARAHNRIGLEEIYARHGISMPMFTGAVDEATGNYPQFAEDGSIIRQPNIVEEAISFGRDAVGSVSQSSRDELSNMALGLIGEDPIAPGEEPEMFTKQKRTLGELLVAAGVGLGQMSKGQPINIANVLSQQDQDKVARANAITARQNAATGQMNALTNRLNTGIAGQREARLQRQQALDERNEFLDPSAVSSAALSAGVDSDIVNSLSGTRKGLEALVEMTKFRANRQTGPVYTPEQMESIGQASILSGIDPNVAKGLLNSGQQGVDVLLETMQSRLTRTGDSPPTQEQMTAAQAALEALGAAPEVVELAGTPEGYKQAVQYIYTADAMSPDGGQDLPSLARLYEWAQGNPERMRYVERIKNIEAGGPTFQNPVVRAGVENLPKVLERESIMLQSSEQLARNARAAEQQLDAMKDSNIGPVMSFAAPAISFIRNLGDVTGLPVPQFENMQDDVALTRMLESVAAQTFQYFRAEGSGAMSDMESRAFMRSLPTGWDNRKKAKMLMYVVRRGNEIMRRELELRNQFRAQLLDSNDPEDHRRALSPGHINSLVAEQLKEENLYDTFPTMSIEQVREYNNAVENNQGSDFLSGLGVSEGDVVLIKNAQGGATYHIME